MEGSFFKEDECKMSELEKLMESAKEYKNEDSARKSLEERIEKILKKKEIKDEVRDDGIYYDKIDLSALYGAIDFDIGRKMAGDYIILKELRTVNNVLRKLSDNDDAMKREEIMSQAYYKATDAAVFANKNGIEALKEFDISDTEGMEGHEFLKEMIGYVCDIEDYETVKNLAITNYFADGPREYEAMVYLEYIVGFLSIKAGEHPGTTAHKILAMIPSRRYWDID